MRTMTRLARFVVPFATLAIGLTPGDSSGQTQPDYLAGSLRDGDPRPVYSSDPSDTWNRIFNALFTRTVLFRLSEDFASNIPMERSDTMGFPDLRISTTVFERIESGDRAIEPLDGFPVHMGSNGSPQRVLSEPRFGQLRQALTEALREESSRPAPSRALMQSDLWAAHDILAASSPRDQDQRTRREELLGLLARSVKKLALSRREIEELPDNFAEAHLPFDLFAEGGEWVEVEYLPERMHDFSADFRRSTRVFLKTSSPPAGRQEWLDGLRGGNRPEDKLDAAALVTQLLLVDTEGVVVPSRLTYEVQVRTYSEGGAERFTEAKLAVAELSRKTILLDRQSGGLLQLGDRDPSYLPSAGNDYFFASSHAAPSGRRETVLAPLRKRCASCHGEGGGVIFTFSVHAPHPPPPVRMLKKADNEHSRDVSRRKMQRPDYEELKRRWDR